MGVGVCVCVGGGGVNERTKQLSPIFLCMCAKKEEWMKGR